MRTKRPFFLFLTLCLMAWHVPNALAGDIVVEEATLIEVDQLPIVRSTMAFKFSNAAIEALNSGVAIFLEFNLKVKRERKYLWDKSVVRLSKRLKLERHALTERFIITDLLDQQRRIFDSLESAFDGINDMSDIPVSSLSEIQQDTYSLAIKAKLDIEALPAPLRPVAYVSPSWRMSSGWYEWTSAH